MKVKLLVSMAGPAAAHNADDEIEVDDATAKRIILRNIAEPIATKLEKGTAEKKALPEFRAVKISEDNQLGGSSSVGPNHIKRFIFPLRR